MPSLISNSCAAAMMRSTRGCCFSAGIFSNSILSVLTTCTCGSALGTALSKVAKLAQSLEYWSLKVSFTFVPSLVSVWRRASSSARPAKSRKKLATICGRSWALMEPLEPTSFSRRLNSGVCSAYWPSSWSPSPSRVSVGWVLDSFLADGLASPAKLRPVDAGASSLPTTRNLGAPRRGAATGCFFLGRAMLFISFLFGVDGECCVCGGRHDEAAAAVEREWHRFPVFLWHD